MPPKCVRTLRIEALSIPLRNGPARPRGIILVTMKLLARLSHAGSGLKNGSIEENRLRRHAMKHALRFGLPLLSLFICLPAHAYELETGTVMICDTQKQAERFV